MHLFLISHGLQGTTSSMMFLVETFEKFKDTKVLNSSINCDGSWFETGPFKNWYLTSDGIDGGGERLIKELKIYLQNNKKDKFDKISFVGSSLGGMYCRYLMGRLYSEKEDSIVVTLDEQKEEVCKLKLINFISLASPLIGVRCLQSNLMHYGTKLFYYRGTGSQLVLEDSYKKPLLLEMCKLDSSYYKSLKSCKIRVTLCSTPKEEWRVPYQSSAITSFKEFKCPDKKIGDLVVRILDDFKDNDIQNDQKFYKGDSKEQMMDEIITNLRKLDWIRIEVELLHGQAAILTESRKEVVETILKFISFD